MKLSRLSTVAISTAIMTMSGFMVVGTAQLLPTDKVSEKADKEICVEADTDIVLKDTAQIEAVAKDIVQAIQPQELLDTLEQNVTKEEETLEVTETEEEAKEEVSEYADKFMVNVSEYLNVRASADENSEVIGKLYAGTGGTVIEKGAEWTKISSGNVEGYASTQYLVFDKDVEAMAKASGAIKATITGESIRVRKGAGTDFGVWGLVFTDEVYTVVSSEGEWIAINFEGETGYISADYATVKLSIPAGITIEEELEQIRIEEERKRQEELERQRKIEEAKAEAKRVAAASQFVETVQTSPYNLTEDDVYLLACLVHSEAGYEPYEGKLAVANVVLNRLNGGYYGDTISDVIYAKGQFSVVPMGRLAQVLAQGPNAESIRAAQEAVSGVNNVPNYASFRSCRVANYSSYNNYTIIGSQVFFN